MGRVDDAKVIYALGRELIASARQEVLLDDSVKWLVDDLEEALLDLKQAVIDGPDAAIDLYTQECRVLLSKLDEAM
jgi:hypothetical protein